MKFNTLSGYKKSKDVATYLINWDLKSLSIFQTRVKSQLYPYWKRHVVYEEFPVVGTKMTLDFVNLTLRVAIEVQGKQHFEYTPYFHKSRLDFGEQIERDSMKQEWCELNNIKLIEVFPNDMPLTKDFLKKYKLIK